jgi:UDP-glucose 4-epimerase
MSKIMHDEGTDVVFNLAVIPLPASLEKPAWTFTQNVDMTLTICELARQGLFRTLIHFSSSEAYGNSISGPMDENHPLNGTTPYAASKAAGDLLVLSYCRTFGIDAAIVRPFNNYGPRQNEASYAGVIPITIASIMRGESPHIFGDGKQTRDYLYVTDTANAAIKTYGCRNTREKVLNIASGKEISINYLVRLIADLMGFKGEIIYEPDRPADVKRHIANIYLAEDLIDFKPTIPFEEGMLRTVDWYKQNISL